MNLSNKPRQTIPITTRFVLVNCSIYINKLSYVEPG